MLLIAKEIFRAIEFVDINCLEEQPEHLLRPILPCLVRMSLCSPLDNSHEWKNKKRKILRCISGIEVVNNLVGLLSVDFHSLELDTRKEQQLRMKTFASDTSGLNNEGVALEFEAAESNGKLRIVLREIMSIMAQTRERKRDSIKMSDLFESEVYVDEVCDVIAIAHFELPELLPIEELALALIYIPNGHIVLPNIMSNVPDSFLDVCLCLIRDGEVQDEDNEIGRKRALTLNNLAKIAPHHSLSIRDICIQHCRMPGLAVSLTLDLAQQNEENQNLDLVYFMTGLLLSGEIMVRNWIAEYFRLSNKRTSSDSSPSTMERMRGELICQLTSCLDDCEEVRFPDALVLKASAFLRLYCALKGMAAMRFNALESALILRLITIRPEHGNVGSNFITLALCTLLACQTLVTDSEKDKVTVVLWLKWLLQEQRSFTNATDGRTYSEMLLLIAIHFHSNQTQAIATLVCNTLGMKSAVKANALSKLRTLFVQEVFTEETTASQAISVKPTPMLNANMDGFLPAHCVHQLLRNHVFTKHKVAVKEWIYKQICACRTPLHPTITQLLQAFINSMFTPFSHAELSNDVITEDQILSHFPKAEKAATAPESKQVSDVVVFPVDTDLTPQVLLLYYVLLYEETAMTSFNQSSTRGVYRYSERLLNYIPIRYLVQLAHKEQQRYASLFPSLLRLVVTHYPHLCMVDDWLDGEVLFGRETGFQQNLQDPQELLSLFDNLPSGTLSLMTQLQLLYVSHTSVLLRYCEDGVASDSIQNMLKALWFVMHSAAPRKMRVETINALSDNSANFVVDLDLCIDPLLVLRVDSRAFRCLPVLQVVLRILESYLLASRGVLQRQQHIHDEEHEQLRVALVRAQESAAAQILIECCLPQGHEDNKDQTKLQEVQTFICARLHNMFIEDKEMMLIKLVHFQGYPSELLPVTVSGIPSMHVCLDFIPELLQQPNMAQKVFAIELTSYLSQHFTLPKTLGVAKLALEVMNTLMSVYSSELFLTFYSATLPALTRICHAFPPLCSESVSFLKQLFRICRNNPTWEHSARTNAISFEKLGALAQGAIESVQQHSKLARCSNGETNKK